MKDALLPPLFSGPALTPVLDSHDFDQWRLVIEGTLQLLLLQGWSQERINGQWERPSPAKPC